MGYFLGDFFYFQDLFWGVYLKHVSCFWVHLIAVKKTMGRILKFCDL